MTVKRLEPPATVAFIGLGKMGAPMAGHLVAGGWKVRGYDLSATALDAFATANPKAVRTASAAEAAARADVAITMLPDGNAVRQTVLADGLARALGPGGLVIDMSSSSPVDTRRLGEELAARGIGLVDAPVSGGVKRAVAAKLAIMAGGDATLVERCRPLLGAMGTTIFATGPLGSGHAMKALNNFVSAAGLVALCEALIIGRRFGLDRSLIVDILNASTGRNNSTEVKAKQFILSGAFNSGFSLGLMAKDLRTAAELAEHLGVTAPVSRATRDLWAQAQGSLGPDADHTEIFRFVEALEGFDR
ncbi:MAG TPA: NAD(P)-dependent oxidoreductase [Candidatus Methylomirabilis sp.]|nr:NAD(P)-dependent oxidoreductase [Candidatus Methylomirabilis sp.]